MSALQSARRYLEVGRPEDALQALSALDGESAASPQAIELRGSAHLALNASDTAADIARHGLEHDPADLGLLYLLSLAEEQRGNLAASESAILAALEQLPDDPQLLTQYADVLMRAGELDKAGRLIVAAEACDPESQDVLNAKISHAYLRRDKQEAERLTRELLAYDPDSVRGHRMLGALALDRGAAADAAERLGEAVRLEPGHDPAAEGARTAQLLQRPYYWPVRFFDRYGPARTWVIAVAVLFSLRSAGLEAVAAPLGFAWLIICAWSWAAASRLKHQLG